MDPATVRQITNVGDEPALYLWQAQGRLLGRDGRLPESETSRLARRAAPAELYGSVAIGAAVLAGCPVFPRDNPWNLRVDSLPVPATAPDDQRRRRRRGPASGLRVGHLRRRPDRDPVHDRARQPAAGADRLRRLRRRVRSRAVPDPAQRPARVRLRPPRARGRPRPLPALRALQRASRVRRRALARRIRRDLEPALQPRPSRRLDVVRRRRPAGPAGPRALRRDPPRPDRPRAAVHGRGVAARVHLPGTPLRLGLEQSEPPGDGSALPPEAVFNTRASRARRGSS